MPNLGERIVKSIPVTWKTVSALVATLSAVLALALPATAQSRPPNLLWSARNDGWSAIQISQGCFLIFYTDGLVKGWGGYDAPDLKVTANASCGPDGLAEGPVWIEFIWTMKTYHVLYKIEGTAHQGVLQGAAKDTIGDDENDTGFHLRELGDARNPSPSFYRDGCEYSDDANGVFNHLMDDACHASGIQPMIDQLRMAGLIGGGGPSGAATPAATAQSSSAAGSGDVFGRCVTLSAEEKRGIQDYWSLTNRCDQPIIARYCFKANFETAGNEALCTRGEYRTTEIKANSKLDFTWGLIDEGTPMSNGVIAGPNALSVVGYACGGGQFPQVTFENGRMKFLGCS